MLQVSSDHAPGSGEPSSSIKKHLGGITPCLTQVETDTSRSALERLLQELLGGRDCCSSVGEN